MRPLASHGIVPFVTVNPWLELPDEPPWALPGDRAALDRWGGDGPVRLDLLPEPFVGDPAAPVVALAKAPGVAPGDASAHREQGVREAIRRSHRAGPGWFHPLEPEMAGTPAEQWWRASLRDLIAEVGEDTVAGGLFVAQAFPYHAEGSQAVDRHPPPSFDFTVDLVRRALDRGALLVVINGRAGWRRALGAATVEGAVQVSSPLAGHLSRRNLGASFDLVAERLAAPPRPSITADRTFREGGVATVVLDRVERNRAARQACLDHWGVACVVCDMTFAERYGIEGTVGIQVHHLHPLADRRGEHTVDPKRDLRPVCPNCHAVLHTASPPHRPEDIAAALRRGRAQG